MDELVELAIDGPTAERATIKFQNLDGPGIFISGQKLANDAANFRQVAEFLRQQKGDGQKFALFLETMAGQFDKAIAGQHPKA